MNNAMALQYTRWWISTNHIHASERDRAISLGPPPGIHRQPPRAFKEHKERDEHLGELGANLVQNRPEAGLRRDWRKRQRRRSEEHRDLRRQNRDDHLDDE